MRSGYRIGVGLLLLTLSSCCYHHVPTPEHWSTICGGRLNLIPRVRVRAIHGRIFVNSGDPLLPPPEGLMTVMLRDATRKSPTRTEPVDKYGRFSFTAVPDGLYALETCLPGFATTLGWVEVAHDEADLPLDIVTWLE